MKRELQIAWAAGFIDGEGTILVGRYRDDRCRSGYLHRPILQVGQSSPIPLDRLIELFGGRYKRHEPNGNRRVKPHWMWTLQSARSVAPALRALLPHLVHKREQAEELLKFCARVRVGGGSHVDPVEFAVREEIRGRLRELNTSPFERVEVNSDEALLDALRDCGSVDSATAVGAARLIGSRGLLHYPTAASVAGGLRKLRDDGAVHSRRERQMTLWWAPEARARRDLCPDGTYRPTT